jgi:hypothetical protein
VSWLARALWVRLPLAVAPISRTLVAFLSDGCYLTRWPPVAAIAPLVAVLYGVALSQTRQPDQVTYTYSLIGMVPVVAIAAFSAALGLYLTLAYAVCDLLLFEHVSQSATLRPAQLVSYLLLALLTVVTPLAARVIRRRTLPDPARLGPAGGTLDTLLAAVIVGGLVFLWTESSAVLIRPIFVWTEAGTPTDQAIHPLQQLGWALALVAAGAAAARAELEPRQGSEAAIEIARALRRQPLRQLPPLVAAVIDGAVLTLLLGGLLDSWLEVPFVFAILSAASAARRLGPAVLPAWPGLLSRVPMIFRVALGIVVAGFVGQAIISTQFALTSSLWPVAAAAVAGMLVMTALVPDLSVGRARLRGGRP